jgi:Sulfotransferase family
MDRDGPVFITGLDRSGKTRLRRLLGAHPDLHLVRRTALWTGDDDRYGDLLDETALADRLDWLRSGQQTSELVAEAGRWTQEFERGPRTTPRMFAAMSAARASLHGKPRWGEQDAEIERHAERLLRMLPSARIVHLVRDPRRRYASITASWIASVRRGMEHAARYPHHYRLVRVEDLEDQPRVAMERLHEFLGLSMLPDILNGWWTEPTRLPELRRQEVTFIEAWAGATMRAMGYRSSGQRTFLGAWHPVEVAGFAARSVREARSSEMVLAQGAAE